MHHSCNVRDNYLCAVDLEETILLHFESRVDSKGPPPWSSGQSSRLQSHRSRVRFPALPVFLNLERGPLSLVRISEELREIKSSGSGLEIRDKGP
jgi:hypothetical protein